MRRLPQFSGPFYYGCKLDNSENSFSIKYKRREKIDIFLRVIYFGKHTCR